MLYKEVKQILQNHKGSLLKLGVITLAIFGSTAKNQSNPKSDVDILVDFDATKGLFGFIDLKDYLESILRCEVDLVSRDALHPALKERILNEAKNIF
ncbi:MAG: nucleotidyltransferase family protein [Parachlamydiaceae bacterium]